VNDVFITEILPNVTQYMSFCDQKELRNRATAKAQQIIKQLQDFYSQSKRVTDAKAEAIKP
jgi:hypothetical protein